MEMKLTWKAARVNAGKTQAQAAKELGVGVTTISNWERGKSAPTVEQYASLCECYGVSIDRIKVLPL